MFEMAVSAGEMIVRALIVYLFLLVALRLTGKRQISESSPFDFVLLLIVADGVQNSMSGGDESLQGGLITAATLFAIDHLIGIISFKNKKAANIIDGIPQVLIYNGKINDKLVKKEKMTKHEIDESLRQEGCTRLDQVKLAVLENNGSISVIKKEDK